MLEIIITSSVLILAILFIRKICWGKISRRMQYGLWILVAVRLLVPAQLLTSPISIMQLVEQITKQEMLQSEENYFVSAEDVEQKVSQSEKLQGSQQSKEINNNQEHQQESISVITSTDRQQNMGAVYANDEKIANKAENSIIKVQWNVIIEHTRSMARGIYIVGVLVMASVLLACNMKFRRILCRKRKQIGREGRLSVYLVKGLEAPCMYGVLKPAIYLNEAGLSSEEYTKHILAHERTHYRHGDHIWTLVRSLCLTLYWFHPLVWVAATLSAKDGELACDEGTLKRLGEKNRLAYGKTLIDMAASKSKRDNLFYCATSMANHKNEIRQRIMVIANGKKPVLGVAVAVLILALVLAACTGGKTPEEYQGTLESEESTDGEFLANEDGSYRLSEYKVELTGDKISDQIVFDVYYYADLEAMAEVITEELLWQELWDGCHVEARVIDGESGQVIWENSFSEAHAGNGNLAVIRYEGQNCLMYYHNLMYQGTGQLYYKILQVQATREEPLILKEGRANYGDGFAMVNDEDIIAKVLEVGEELDGYLAASDTKVLLNASLDREDCYLRSSKGVMLNGEKNQTSVDVFKQELSGNGWELTLRDFFYPDGMESLTVLPEDAEARILAGEVFFMEVSEENATAGRLDLDGDGVKEVIYLYGLNRWPGVSGWHYWPAGTPGYIDVKYRIRVNEHYLEDYCDIMDPLVMAYSPDGEEILLALYDDGPSGDPETMFFRYDDTGLHPAGSIPADLRMLTDEDGGMRRVTLEDGLIRCSRRIDMMQTEWVWSYYEWNGNEMVLREDEIYYYTDAFLWPEENQMPLMLLREITVFAERSESSEAFVLKPQEVRHVATDGLEWILLEGRDGTKGWIRMEGFSYFPSEEATSLELFEGLNMVVSKPDSLKQNIMLADISPSLLLEGEVPRLIDEWQIVPK